MRYILFGTDYHYYAKGGANDFVEGSDDVHLLIKLAGKHMALPNDHENYIAWWHVFDTETLTIVAGTEIQPYGAPNLVFEPDTDR